MQLGGYRNAEYAGSASAPWVHGHRPGRPTREAAGSCTRPQKIFPLPSVRTDASGRQRAITPPLLDPRGRPRPARRRSAWRAFRGRAVHGSLDHGEDGSAGSPRPASHASRTAHLLPWVPHPPRGRLPAEAGAVARGLAGALADASGRQRTITPPLLDRRSRPRPARRRSACACLPRPRGPRPP